MKRLDPEAAAVLGCTVSRRLRPAEARRLAASLRRITEALPAHGGHDKALERLLLAGADVLETQATHRRRPR